MDEYVHAIDPGLEHPALVYLARCGRPLLRQTPLQVVPPGPRCPACIAGSAR